MIIIIIIIITNNNTNNSTKMLTLANHLKHTSLSDGNTGANARLSHTCVCIYIIIYVEDHTH